MRFAFDPGRQVTYGASIRNPGPWPVTITGINRHPADQQVFKVAKLAVNQPEVATDVTFDPAEATPFHPIRLAAGMELPVFITITMPNVTMDGGGGVFSDGLSVDYEVLGLPRHQRVPMGFRLMVYS
ncbi:hypothetical protein [Micromonospora sp. NPDC049645]|uniref:hypothetical protein n=1 Tax=Micromonospora sp. NPDC049645 TaxID=3155508 RepID=UPI00342EB024